MLVHEPTAILHYSLVQILIIDRMISTYRQHIEHVFLDFVSVMCFSKICTDLVGIFFLVVENSSPLFF